MVSWSLTPALQKWLIAHDGMWHLQLTFIGLSLFAKLLMMSKESWNLVPPLRATSAINWLTAIIICCDKVEALLKQALIKGFY